MQTPWIIGNWKMNGRIDRNIALINAFKTFRLPEKVHIGIASPYPYIHQLYTELQETSIWVGAEDCSQFYDDGAYTGEVSANMLADCGAKFVIIGHSERRTYFSENNDLLKIKLQNALSAGLLPIFCVGETLQERESGQEEKVIASQLAILRDFADASMIVAYEPVWAIGTGKVAEPEQIQAMHQFINEEILSITGKRDRIPLLYGGSVNADNASIILKTSCVDGALVGGASLKADVFMRIITAATE